mmetsp:Transcript_56541/g.132663  ORF Transcript_56541/g.132663 Transcript_56541/m.132663 type:complete len:159 (+) Transcript_56541:200-676(+)
MHPRQLSSQLDLAALIGAPGYRHRLGKTSQSARDVVQHGTDPRRIKTRRHPELVSRSQETRWHLSTGVSTCRGPAGHRYRFARDMSMALALRLMRTVLIARVGASGSQAVLGALPLAARAASPADQVATAGARGYLEAHGGIQQDVLHVSTRRRASLE